MRFQNVLLGCLARAVARFGSLRKSPEQRTVALQHSVFRIRVLQPVVSLFETGDDRKLDRLILLELGVGLLCADLTF